MMFASHDVAVTKTCAGRNETVARLFPLYTSSKEVTMAGILMWLMGVPLIVIILLYLIF
jgi:hypothetical protein